MIMTITLEKIDELNCLELRLPKICNTLMGNLTIDSLILATCDVVRQQVFGVSGILVNNDDACDFIRISLDHFEQDNADSASAAFAVWLLDMKEKYAEGSGHGGE